LLFVAAGVSKALHKAVLGAAFRPTPKQSGRPGPLKRWTTATYLLPNPQVPSGGLAALAGLFSWENRVYAERSCAQLKIETGLARPDWRGDKFAAELALM
jgi:hypothetical protein